MRGDKGRHRVREGNITRLSVGCVGATALQYMLVGGKTTAEEECVERPQRSQKQHERKAVNHQEQAAKTKGTECNHNIECSQSDSVATGDVRFRLEVEYR